MTTTTAPSGFEPSPFDTLVDTSVHLFSGYLVRTALALRLPDHLGTEPASLDELAQRTGTKPAALRQLLRALSTLGYFRPAGADPPVRW